MPTPSHTKCPYDEALIIQLELDHDFHEQLSIVNRDVLPLNSKQYTMFTAIMSSDHKQYPKGFFIDGPGDTGKTLLYNTLMAKVRFQGQIALGLASSGLAALLSGGRPVHCRLKASIDINELSVCTFSKQSSLAQVIKRTALLAWDEACVSNKHAT